MTGTGGGVTSARWRGGASGWIIEGVAVRVAALDDLIASKEWADRAKDHHALPELRELRRAEIALARARPATRTAWPSR